MTKTHKLSYSVLETGHLRLVIKLVMKLVIKDDSPEASPLGCRWLPSHCVLMWAWLCVSASLVSLHVSDQQSHLFLP